MVGSFSKRKLERIGYNIVSFYCRDRGYDIGYYITFLAVIGDRIYIYPQKKGMSGVCYKLMCSDNLQAMTSHNLTSNPILICGGATDEQLEWFDSFSWWTEGAMQLVLGNIILGFLAASTECSAGSNDHFVVGGLLHL
jgi:hypothetical protein